MRLYEISREFVEAFKLLDDMVDGAEIDKATMDDSLAGIRVEFNEKAINVIKYAKEIEMFAKEMKETIDKMRARQKTLEKRAEYFRGYVLDNMLLMDLIKIETAEFRINIKMNPERVVVDEDRLDDEFYRVKTIREVDKVKIKDLLKAGAVVPGARLERTRSLSVR